MSSDYVIGESALETSQMSGTERRAVTSNVNVSTNHCNALFLSETSRYNPMVKDEPKLGSPLNSKEDPFMRRISLAFLILLSLTIANQTALARQLGKVNVETFDGRLVEAELDSIADDGTLQGSNTSEIRIQDTLSIVKLKPETTAPRAVKVYLTTGGHLFASDFTTNGLDTTLISKSVIGTFPLENVKAIVWTESRKVRTALENRSSENDQVVVVSGEDEVIVQGLLEEVNENKVTLNYRGESKKIARDKVLAIVTADLQPSEPRGTIGRVALADGSEVSGAVKSMASGALVVGLDRSNSIKLSSRQVRSIEIKSDRIAFLSTLTPSEFDQRSDFGIERTWQADKSVTGNPLTLNGDRPENPLTFKRGIGTQSYSRLVFDVPADFDRFQALVGIATETKGRGDCELVVSADGIQLWKERVTANDPPMPIDVDIAGASQLTLTIRPGKQFDLSDHANWCNARFLNTK